VLNPERLSLAIEIHARSYKLLRWINRAIQEGLIPLGRTTTHSDTPEAAVEWISTNYALLPSDLQPNREHLREFASFFWTYLISSFDVVANPGTRLEPGECGCLCPLCARIRNAPHLQPKKLRSSDKQRARELMAERIAQLASEHGIPLAREKCQMIAADPETSRAAGYSAYGYWLIQRLAGDTDGPSILALWRVIAWKKAGSPIPEFRLRYEDFESSEELLRRVLQDVAEH
jgi:hypothetical protein